MEIVSAHATCKPVIVIDDAVSSDLRIVKNEKNYLIRDRTLAARNLTRRDLAAWWVDRERASPRIVDTPPWRWSHLGCPGGLRL